MKRLARNVAAITLLAPTLIFNAFAESKPDPTLGTSLSDCSAFFGLLSQAQSQFSEGMKEFALAATSYAAVAFSKPREAETAVGKSMVRLSDEFPKLQRDQEAFKYKFETCLSTLKIAELELRPQLDETTKALVPEYFRGNQ